MFKLICVYGLLGGEVDRLKEILICVVKSLGMDVNLFKMKCYIISLLLEYFLDC